MRDAAWNILDEKIDTRTTAQRVADVLSESHREDTSADFRLGLLQGALAVALPELLAVQAANHHQLVNIRFKAADFLAEAEKAAGPVVDYFRDRPTDAHLHAAPSCSGLAIPPTRPGAKNKARKSSQPASKWRSRHA